MCVYNNEVLNYFKYYVYNGRSLKPTPDRVILYDKSGNAKYQWAIGNDGTTTYTLPVALTIQFLSPSDGAILKLKGLPNGDPHIVNAVYRENGVLKISTGS